MTLSHKKEIGNKLYQNIGKIFYAVAIADKTIHAKEVEILNNLVQKKWLDVDEIEDEYGTDAAFQIEIVFDWLQEYEKDGNNCFKEFSTFYNEHKNIFTPEIKDLIIQTANSIAYAFAGINKSELIVLAKLKLIFD